MRKWIVFQNVFQSPLSICKVIYSFFWIEILKANFGWHINQKSATRKLNVGSEYSIVSRNSYSRMCPPPQPKIVVFTPFRSENSLRSRRLEVVGTSKNRRARRTCVSPSRAPVLSFARYFQAPATQASLKTCIDFLHFSLESGMVFEGTTGVFERTYLSIQF